MLLLGFSARDLKPKRGLPLRSPAWDLALGARPSPARPGPARSPTPTFTHSPSPGGGETFIPEAKPLPAPSPGPSTPPDTLDSVSPRPRHFPLWASLRLMHPLD